jgi:hypothetical protein
MANPLDSALQTITIRARPRMVASDWRARLSTAPIIVWFAAAGLLIAGAVRDPTLGGWFVSVAAVILVIAVPNGLARLNARIRITPDSVEYRGMFRVPRRCQRSQISAARRLQLAVLGPRFNFGRLLLIDPSGRARISIQEEWFALDDLDKALDALALTVSTTDDPLPPRQANRLYPGAASFALVNRFAVLAFVLLVCFAVVGAFLPTQR